MTEPFIPTLKWHIKVLVILLVLCVAALFIGAYVQRSLPLPYQKRNPAPETMPWKFTEEHK